MSGGFVRPVDNARRPVDMDVLPSVDVNKVVSGCAAIFFCFCWLKRTVGRAFNVVTSRSCGDDAWCVWSGVPAACDFGSLI